MEAGDDKGPEAARAPPKHDGGGSGSIWARRISVGSWRTAAAEATKAARAEGGGGSGGDVPCLRRTGHRWGCASKKKGRGRTRKGVEGPLGLLDEINWLLRR